MDKEREKIKEVCILYSRSSKEIKNFEAIGFIEMTQDFKLA